jgi:hypothetical protein
MEAGSVSAPQNIELKSSVAVMSTPKDRTRIVVTSRQD